jgi:hypothetical protein
MQCRELRLKGDRVEVWRVARQLPLGMSKVKWLLSVGAPTSLVSYILGI